MLESIEIERKIGITRFEWQDIREMLAKYSKFQLDKFRSLDQYFSLINNDVLY